MLNYYLYPILLTICMFLCGYCIKESNGNLSYKIRNMVGISLGLLILRYISLVALLLSRNMIYLYYLKAFIFLEIYALPTLTILASYIVVRNNCFKLNYVIYAYIIWSVGYGFFMKVSPFKLVFAKNYGYRFMFYGNIIPIIAIIVFYNLIMLAILFVSKKTNHNLVGSILIACSLMSLDIGTSFRFFNIEIFQEPLLWDFSVLLLFIYIIYKKKKDYQ